MVKIRLARYGRKKHPVYKMVVVDNKKPRESDYIEYIGTYDPILKTGNINIEKAKVWLEKGAQPTERAAKILKAFGLEEIEIPKGK
ncbi:30S ribosomal protein S16 [Hydrogenothermus marinus]|uniref:Small ribosomal subunit protein bS16 n=1 Tax=Hydrogenothermus marinus TaxID=133270 RepID=A0A3M0B6V1_9AQUI|nr:30S ribosomal protein S16 [Hydrogenothermus marinus]RMA93093.1 small subunit ribosomal protein S16 [Hydrogenothermus marinus]